VTDFFKEYDVAAVWMMHLLSFIIASLLRITRVLKAYNNTHDRPSVILPIARYTTFVLAAFILIDQLVFRLVLKLYFLGSYTDWIIYIIVFAVLDIFLIGTWPGSEKGKNLRSAPFFRFAGVYRALRALYVLVIVARFVVAGFMGTTLFGYFNGFVVGDYARGTETETFSGLYFEMKSYGEGLARQDLVIYKKHAGIFKKQVFIMRDIGHNASNAIYQIPYSQLGDDTILFHDLSPSILIRQADGYLYTNRDERLEEHKPFWVDGVLADTVINIKLK
jgi:hypothetical protein